MQQVMGRRMKVVAAAMAAALVLVGASGCGGSSGGGGSAGATKTTKASSTDGPGTKQDGGGSATGASGEKLDPCELVSIETASEILGGEAAEPTPSSADLGTTGKACSWQTQAGVDDPTIDGAGRVLTLTVLSPPASMTLDAFWKASKGAADEQADIEGCDEAFWSAGVLSGLKGGVYLSGTAGLADDSPDAKDSVTDLVSAACGSIS